MKKAKKLILLFIVLFTISGCKDSNYYEKVANTAIGFYKSEDYKKSYFNKNDIPAIDNFLSTLTHENETINISKLIQKSDNYKTSAANSSDIWVDNGICYMNYSDLKSHFDEYYINNSRPVISAHYTVVCDGYFVNILEDDLMPDYSATTSNPKYDYILMKNEKVEGNYYYYYKSTFDSTGIKLSIILEKNTIKEITVEDAEQNEFK